MEHAVVTERNRFVHDKTPEGKQSVYVSFIFAIYAILGASS